ncbi:porin family protein, partial [Microvirga aerilata]
MKTRILGLLAATAISTAAISAASAADLPMRSAPPAPVFAPAPVFTWTGFYVGVNAGYGWSEDDNDAVDFADDDNDGGFIGGAQVGYNHQISSFVVGLEG